MGDVRSTELKIYGQKEEKRARVGECQGPGSVSGAGGVWGARKRGWRSKRNTKIDLRTDPVAIGIAYL